MDTVTIFSRINSAAETEGNVYCLSTGYQQNFYKRPMIEITTMTTFLRVKPKFPQAGFLKLTPVQGRAAVAPM